MRLSDLLAVPAERAGRLRPLVERLLRARRVVLTTHVNADGDGAGSQAAMAAWLEANGARAAIVNPTRFPEGLRFLLHRPDLALDLEGGAAEAALDGYDLAIVLDTSEANRVAPLSRRLDPERTIVVDHHPPGPTVLGHAGVQDPSASATGELVYDILSLADAEWTPAVVLGVYVALVSDTGSFRFSNTTPRAHAIAAEMLARGVDPETVFRRLYGTYPRRRFELLREALASLDSDPALGVTWMVVPARVARDLRVTHEDFEGLIDHARSVEGTRVAILFREMESGGTKISFRSNGATDVNRIAREFGGGGHVKAAGAHMDEPADTAVPRVLETVREVLRNASGDGAGARAR